MRPANDFTTRRKVGNIIVCPMCGRKGFLKQYRDGSRHVWHRVEYPPPYGDAHVTDHCVVVANP